jgi:hypothetical protein
MPVYTLDGKKSKACRCLSYGIGFRMNNEPVAYINVEERKLEWAKPTTWNTPTIAQMDKIPLYAHPAKTLTDEEILQFRDKVPYSLGSDLIEFARAILRKAQEK